MPERSIETIVWIGIGGFIGANARYWLSAWVAARLGTGFPWGTLLINASGALLLAAFAAWSVRQMGLTPNLRLLFAVGFCGAYTTFSTFALDTITLAQSGQWGAALLNMLLNDTLSLLAVAGGLLLGGGVR